MNARNDIDSQDRGHLENLLKASTGDSGHYVLRLYVTGTTSRSIKAISTIHALCEEHLKGRYDLKVIDIYQQPDDARQQHIIAAPTLVRTEPLPARRIIGDLSDPRKVFESLDIEAAASHSRGEEAAP